MCSCGEAPPITHGELGDHLYRSDRLIHPQVVPHLPTSHPKPVGSVCDGCWKARVHGATGGVQGFSSGTGVMRPREEEDSPSLHTR